MKKCKIKGECFARQEGGLCRILMETPAGKCSFQKPEMMITDGKLYKYHPEKCKGADDRTIRLLKRKGI